MSNDASLSRMRYIGLKDTMLQNVFFYSSLFKIGSTNECELVLFDFTVAQNVSDWYEVSDTVRNVGKSKATIILQKTQGLFN